MFSRISHDEMGGVFSRAVKKGFINKEEDTSVLFYDLSLLKTRIEDIRETFPTTTLNAVAVKANPLIKILDFMAGLGVGLETGTYSELCIAERIGIPAGKIVYYSPAKTISEIKYALRLGVHLNVDNFQELDRIASLMNNISTNSSIGIRLNPQVGVGKIHATSTAGDYSKFGISIKQNRKRLIESYQKHNWLRGVHVHIGSQGCSVDLLINGIGIVYDFVEELNTYLKGRKIDVFDIGGGLPVSYWQEESPPSLAEYKEALKARCPKLFTDEFRLITEFGRYIHANAGWVASRVEYVKKNVDVNTAIIHIGADLFLRKCYNPDAWHHDISVIDHNGNIKSGKEENYVIGGPLCFSGDILAKGIKLPEIKEGDYILIHDAGAYTLSLWSRHMSRAMPKVIGYYGEETGFTILKDRESFEDIWKFWI